MGGSLNRPCSMGRRWSRGMGGLSMGGWYISMVRRFMGVNGREGGEGKLDGDERRSEAG